MTVNEYLIELAEARDIADSLAGMLDKLAFGTDGQSLGDWQEIDEILQSWHERSWGVE